MSDFAARLAKLPEANASAWNEINAIIKSTDTRQWQSNGRVVQVRYYEPGDDKWEFADIHESKQRAIQAILRNHPLGGDHFQEWLDTGKVKLGNMNHPADPGFLAAYLEIHWVCGVLQVGHSLIYTEYDHQWSYDIQSASRQEEFTGKSYSLSTACECVLEHLFKVGKNQLLAHRGLRATSTTTSNSSVLDKSHFVMGYGAGRVNLKAGENLRTPHYVTDIQNITFTHRTGGRRDEVPVVFELSKVERDIDQLEYRLLLEGTDVGMVQFDFGHRTIEWEIERKYIGTTVSYTAVLSKTKP